MIVSKLYFSKEKMINKKEYGCNNDTLIQNVFMNLCDKKEANIIASVYDTTVQQYNYVILKKLDGIYYLKAFFENIDEYMLDCGVRMILNQLFKNGEPKIVVQIEAQDVTLQQVCRKIGLTELIRSNGVPQFSISYDQFYEHMC